jgi:tartrate dehydratase beta subunit/fumarate hydratase class I family protein
MGKWRFANTSNITWPTIPVAPTTATRMNLFLLRRYGISALKKEANCCLPKK